jgi:N-sulfoglucosamine sulfohydrolase
MQTLARLGLAALSLAAFSTCLAAPGPNIVLFVSDDHGLEAGCYGHQTVRTPHLDRLCGEGTRFLNAYCTTASCSASRSVLLTGLHNHFTGQFGHQHDVHNFHSYTSLRTLPVRLAQAGYRTARIGKFHVQPDSVYHFQTVLTGNPDGGRNPVTMAERCREFISATNSPFFLYFCTDDPHRSAAYADELPGRPNLFGNERKQQGVNEEKYDPANVIVPPYLPDTPETRAELAQYYQSISRVDQGIGRLVQILKETSQYDKTLFVYLSDNGPAFVGAKTTLYDPGMRLPLVVRAPNQHRRGISSKAMVSWVDIAPTLLEFAGVHLPSPDLPPLRQRLNQRPGDSPQEYPFHGKSFRSVMEQENPDGWNEVFASHTFHEITMYYPMRVAQNRQYKYILNLAHRLPYPFASDLHASPTWQSVLDQNLQNVGKRSVEAFINRPRHELYDLLRDPDEVANLADDPDFAIVLQQMQERLRRFQERTRDPWLVKYAYE